MKRVITRYKWPAGILAANAALLLFAPKIGACAFAHSVLNCRELLMVIPPIFILIGLLDAWVERDAMTRLMGPKSGAKGVLMAFLLGSVAAGPLYAAFPIVGVLLRKGSSIANAIIFIGAWSTTKIPMLLFETSAMGWRFALARFLLDVPAVLIIARLTERLLSTKEEEDIRRRAVQT